MSSQRIKTAIERLHLTDAQTILYSVGLLHGSAFGIDKPDPLLINFASYRHGWSHGCELVRSLGDLPEK